MKIRRTLFFILLISVFTFSFSYLNFSQEDLAKKAARIHDRVLTIDTHTDTPMAIARSNYNIGERHESGGRRSGKVDLPRMKEGGLDAVFFAVYLGQGERTLEANEEAKQNALSIFEAIHKAVKENSDLAELALTPDDAYRIEKTGKRAIYIGIENGYPVGNDLTLVKKYYDLGARYITLCHSSNNDICDSSTDRNGAEYNGLSEFGEKVVAEMNRLGMLVDISHASDETFYDVIKSSKAPIIASHSCARAICDNRRNLNDDMLKKLAENGGVIQMCILGNYVKASGQNEMQKEMKEIREKYGSFLDMTDEDRAKRKEEMNALREKYPPIVPNVSDVVDHIDHIVKVAGIDHVGIGTDFDGGGGLEGCNDVSEMGNITLELVKRGYSEDDIKKIWGENFMRVFREVEKVAKES